MSSRFVFTGLQEMLADLRKLPAELAGEGGDLVEGRGDRAMATIAAGYPSRTGDLRTKLKVTHTRSAFGARSVVRNSSKHALPYDAGSQTVRITKRGISRGTMPPTPIFSQTIARERRAMYGDLKELLERHGLTVTDVG